MSEAIYFDNAAGDYDDEFTTTTIGKLQRQRVWKQVEKIIATKSNSLSILEINCGTGEDAIQFAKLGHTVTATDASGKMINVAIKKKVGINPQQTIIFEQCEFSGLLDKYKGKQFDIIFSDFGGLNCVDKKEINSLSTDFAELLAPKGSLLFVIMGSNCLWERFYFSLKRNFVSARRRKKNGVETIIKSSVFKTFYFSPKEITQLFNHNFTFQFVKPIGLFIPPSYLESFFTKRKFLLAFLNTFEKLFGNISTFSNMADHYFIHLTKKA